MQKYGLLLKNQNKRQKNFYIFKKNMQTPLKERKSPRRYEKCGSFGFMFLLN